MRNKSFKLVFTVSVILVLTLIFGLAGNAFAKTSEDSIEVLVSFGQKPGKDEKALIENEGGIVKRTYHIVPTIAASVPKGKLDSLRRHPRIVSVEEDIPVEIIEQIVPWGVERIEAKAVHSENKGRGVKVAILDTGIDLDHPDLRVVGNVSFVPETLNGDDDNGHGTMVAGIVAALDNGIGVVGVAPEVELYSVKVLNRNGSGVMSLILAGIEWATDNGIQVINMSFGGILNWPWAVQAALDKAYQSGIVLMDAHMPGMSGVEATWYLKRDGLNYDGEVVLLAESEDYRAKALEAGTACLLLKEIKCGDLARAIREVYQGKQSRESNADLAEELIELVIPPPANAADLLKFMCQLRQPLEENYASIVRTVGSWDSGTVITIAIRAHRLSHLLAKLVNMPELEKVEEQPRKRSTLSSFPTRFGSLPRLNLSPSQIIRITLKEATKPLR